MVSPRKTDVMLARRAEQHKKVDVEMVPARRAAVELLKRAAATARVVPAKRVAVVPLKKADTACSVEPRKKAAAVLLKKVDAELLRRVAVVPLKRVSLKRDATAARRAEVASRCLAAC